MTLQIKKEKMTLQKKKGKDDTTEKKERKGEKLFGKK